MNQSPLSNPLATVEQLEISSSQLDGVPANLETSIRFASARLIQAAGILLRLPQEVIAQAIVIFTRYWVGPEGGSLSEFGAEVSPATASRIAVLFIILIKTNSKYPPAAYIYHPNSPRFPNQRAVL